MKEFIYNPGIADYKIDFYLKYKRIPTEKELAYFILFETNKEKDKNEPRRF